MVIKVSKHAVRRYKQRVINRKTTSGQKCIDQIKAAVKSAYRISKLNATDVRNNYGAFYYYTKNFIAVVQRNGCCLFIVTIKNYHEPINNNDFNISPKDIELEEEVAL